MVHRRAAMPIGVGVRTPSLRSRLSTFETRLLQFAGPENGRLARWGPCVPWMKFLSTLKCQMPSIEPERPAKGLVSFLKSVR
jgi:hypothetical protein